MIIMACFVLFKINLTSELYTKKYSKDVGTPQQ